MSTLLQRSATQRSTTQHSALPTVQESAYQLGRLRARRSVLEMVIRHEAKRDAILTRCARNQQSQLEKEILAEAQCLEITRRNG